jgi:hypothetical protein
MRVKIIPQAKNLYKRKRHKNNGWKKHLSYYVHGFDSDYVTGEDDGQGYVILVNDYNEIWFVSNRHVRVTHEFYQPQRM